MTGSVERKTGEMPHAGAAERHVVGALLLDAGALDEVGTLIGAADFADPINRAVFETIARMHAERKPVDLVTVTDEMRATKIPALASTLTQLADEAVTAANVVYYARLVRDRAVARGLIHAAQAIQAEAFRADRDPLSMLDRAESAIMAVGRRMLSAVEPSTASELIPRAFKRLEEAYARRGTLVGISTGFADLDRLTCGLEDEELIVIGARPGHGKSAIAGSMALAAAEQGRAVAIFGLEMSRDQTIDRMLAARSGVSLVKMRSGSLNAADFPLLAEAAGEIAKLPIVFDDEPALTPFALRAKARRMHRRQPLGLVVVDYVQLMNGAGDNREQAVSDCSRSLKQLAKELGCPVIALAQLSREVEKRTPPLPRNSDLRESGSLEADADKVFFLTRKALWNDKCALEFPRDAFLIVGKNRNGPTGTVKLDFDPPSATFHNAAHGGQTEAYE